LGISRKKPVPDVIRNELGFFDEDTRKQGNQNLAAAGIFRKPPAADASSDYRRFAPVESARQH
jgi:hypothetical protein